MKEIQIFNLVVAIVYLLTEVFCLVATVKCFSIPKFRTGLALIPIFLCFHIVLIINSLILLNKFYEFIEQEVFEIFNCTSAIGKDLFLLFFTSRILGVVGGWEKNNKLPNIIKVFIWILIPLHLGTSIVVKILTNVRKLSIYLGTMGLFIALLYGYTCIKILPHFRNKHIHSNNGYLRWLLITIIYMIFACEVKIFYNISEFLGLSDKLQAKDDLFREILYKCTGFITTLIPIILMTYCLFKFASISNSETEEELDEY